MNQLDDFEGRQIGLFRIAGYGLLALSLFDYVNIFIPPKFLDPVWEFQTMTSLVDRAPVPFLGLVFVFYGENLFRDKIERPFLKLLSWAALLVGVLFLLLVPLGIKDSFRIDSNTEALIRYQTTQQLTQTKQVADIMNKAISPQDITNVLTALNNQKPLPQIQDPQGVKKEVLSKIDTYQKQVQQQSEGVLKSRRRNLIKESIKINLGSLVAGFLFIYLWRVTLWARRRKLR